MKNDALKIAFVTSYDVVNDPSRFSGLPHYLYHALARRGQVEQVISPAPPRPLWHKLYWRVWQKVTGRRYMPALDIPYLQKIAHKNAEDLQHSSADVALIYGQANLAYWQSPMPVASLTDGFYGVSNSPTAPPIPEPDKVHAIGQMAVNNAVRVFVTSQYTLDQARENAGIHIPDQKAIVTNIGANFPEFITEAIPATPPPPLKLLWVGSNWEGKGGDIALQILTQLRQQGIQTELHLVGNIPDHVRHPYAIRHGFLHKDNPLEQQRLFDIYQQSHLFLHPTLQDFAPAALAEAAAMGVPAIATPIGGIPHMFAPDEITLIPHHKYAANAPTHIQNMITSNNLPTLAKKVRKRYELELNWDIIADKIFTELKNAQHDI